MTSSNLVSKVASRMTLAAIHLPASRAGYVTTNHSTVRRVLPGLVVRHNHVRPSTVHNVFATRTPHHSTILTAAIAAVKRLGFGRPGIDTSDDQERNLNFEDQSRNERGVFTDISEKSIVMWVRFKEGFTTDQYHDLEQEIATKVRGLLDEGGQQQMYQTISNIEAGRASGFKINLSVSGWIPKPRGVLAIPVPTWISTDLILGAVKQCGGVAYACAIPDFRSVYEGTNQSALSDEATGHELREDEHFMLTLTNDNEPTNIDEAECERIKQRVEAELNKWESAMEDEVEKLSTRGSQDVEPKTKRAAKKSEIQLKMYKWDKDDPTKVGQAALWLKLPKIPHAPSAGEKVVDDVLAKIPGVLWAGREPTVSDCSSRP